MRQSLALIASAGFAKAFQDAGDCQGRSQRMYAEALAGKRYLNLETYRKTGKGVRTPVWFAAGPKDTGGPRLYVYTTADSGKAKRIRRTNVVRIAPCDVRGRVTGPWIAARAEIVGGNEFEVGMRLLDRKYWPWKQMLNLSASLFPRHGRVMIVIRPA